MPSIGEDLNWNNEFVEWVRNNDLLYDRFQHLSFLLKSYLIEKVLVDTDTTERVVLRFHDVLNNCNNITYNETGIVEAYSIFHFLDRYHRFQEIFISLIEQNSLPVFRRRTIQILDIGTGPAPALFAISDIYDLIREFGKLKAITNLENLQIQCDYVERSQEFRRWLHNFTEYVNYKSDKYHWQVPYHHGSFDEFKNIQLTRKIYKDNKYTSYLYKEVNLSFDLIITSNFFTEEYQLDSLSNELNNLVLRLRNRGLLLVVGARGSVYPKIYEKLSTIVEDGKYSNYKFKAYSKKIFEQDFNYSYLDKYGILLKDLVQSILNRIRELNVEDKIPTRVAKTLNSTISNKYDKEIAWRTLVFKKFTKLRFKQSKI